jgi:hypothetical protein
MGIEPTAQAWEAWVLPLYDARLAAILVAIEWPRQTALRPKKKAPGWAPSESNNIKLLLEFVIRAQ